MRLLLIFFSGFKIISFHLKTQILAGINTILHYISDHKHNQIMSKILGLRTTIYKVPDVTLAKAWYTSAFDTAPYFDEPYYVGFNIGGYELGLLPDVEPQTAKTGNVVTYWGVEDIHAAFRKLTDLGATANEIPENVGGDIMTATVKDPWG
jgi:predicted enzyme related to lactoylglutathione lyase